VWTVAIASIAVYSHLQIEERIRPSAYESNRLETTSEQVTNFAAKNSSLLRAESELENVRTASCCSKLHINWV